MQPHASIVNSTEINQATIWQPFPPSIKSRFGPDTPDECRTALLLTAPAAPALRAASLAEVDHSSMNLEELEKR